MRASRLAVLNHSRPTSGSLGCKKTGVERCLIQCRRMHGCPDLMKVLRASRRTHMKPMARNHIKPIASERLIDPGETQRRERLCLSCRGAFDSAWVGERICPRCKGSSAWRSGSSRTYTRS
jgi:hypothetical protein